jgi:hypothetical protein
MLKNVKIMWSEGVTIPTTSGFSVQHTDHLCYHSLYDYLRVIEYSCFLNSSVPQLSL